MNILVINPPNTPYTPEGILIEPVDALQIATCIKECGIQVSVLDMDRKKCLIFPDIETFDWFIIVHDYHIPLHNESTLTNIKACIAQIHSRNKKVILCGKYATYGNRDNLDYLGADYYVEGPAESKIVSIITNTQFNDYDKIGNLPPSDRYLVNLNDYIDVRTILTSRGCHQHCRFCNVPAFWGGWSYKRPEDVITEIKLLYRNHGARKILFLDDNALVNRERMIKICELLKAHQFEGLTLGCLGSSDRVDEELLVIMYSAGFKWIHMGVENGDIATVVSTGKKINIQHTKQVIDVAKKIGFRVRCSFIMDLPGLDKHNIFNTQQFIMDTLPHEIRLHYLTSRLGSQYHLSGLRASTQSIHHPEPTIINKALSKNVIVRATDSIISMLEKEHGYKNINSIQEFNDMTDLVEVNPNLLLVAQCPIRYGLKW